ncbi:MAG: MFS transporter, partial [Acholeplasmataceae bacterium]
MKLDYRKTLYIGLIFFGIALFWQAYDMMVARILIDKFGLNQTWSGVIMALDNVMAVFLLPLFGWFSDKSNSKIGKRTPYIIVGTVVAAFAFMGLSYADHYQSLKIEETNLVYMHDDVAFGIDDDIYSQSHWVFVIDSMRFERQEALSDQSVTLSDYTLWQSQILEPMEDLIAESSENLTHREVSLLRDYYYNYLSSRAWQLTIRTPIYFSIFSLILFFALIGMSVYRSPAVALMPDITSKPLRSKANALMTLMGALGGIIAVNIIMFSNVNTQPYGSHTFVFFAVGIIMLITLGIFLWKVREPLWVAERKALDQAYDIEHVKKPVTKAEKKMSRARKKSLYFLLASIFLWFFGYNAVMSKIADYLPKVLNINFSSLPFLFAQLFVIITIVPVGFLTTKIGRKKSVLLGIAISSVSITSIVFLNESINYLSAVAIAISGVGWIMINVNSYPMTVELGRGSSIGKYTGYYYAASMSAQIFTPVISGYLMDTYTRLILFPYAGIFVALSFITMLFVKHGDAQGVNIMPLANEIKEG